MFSAENIKKYDLPKITKFAEYYTLYEGVTGDGLTMFFIVIETNKFDKQNLIAVSFYWHFIQDKVVKVQAPSIEADGTIKTSNVRPQVYICPAFVVTDAMMRQHIPTDLLPCYYRFAPLTEMYPLIGSANGIGGLTFNYVRRPYEKLYDGREYPIVYDNDPIVKIMNAMPGELITCDRIIFEAHPYQEKHTRVVVATNSTVDTITASGLCYGTSDKE